MTCNERRSACAQRTARSASRRRMNPRAGFVVAALLLGFARGGLAQNGAPDPEIGRMFERALADAETFRKELKTSEYDAIIRVQEWDRRGNLRGTANARAIVRPGDPKPMTYVAREVQGKVRLPDDKPGKDDEKEITLQEFSRQHRIAERFAFEITGTDEVAGERA